MGIIVLYDQTNFKGMSKQFVRNEPDLSEKMFNDTARSARVEGQHCIAYTDADYRGEFIIFGQGDYETLGPNFNHRLSSLRLVEEDLLNPEIVLFEHVDYDGEHREITKKVDDLRRGNFNNLVSSHKVKRGVWILYMGLHQAGPRLITFKGDKWRDYRYYGWNDKLSSLHPLVNSYTEVGPTPSVRLQREGYSCGMCAWSSGSLSCNPCPTTSSPSPPPGSPSPPPGSPSPPPGSPSPPPNSPSPPPGSPSPPTNSPSPPSTRANIPSLYCSFKE